MYIYADESGNEGRNIFGSQRAYYLGAIISSSNIDELLKSVFEDELTRQKRIDPSIDRIHAKNMLPADVHSLSEKILHELNSVNWVFHLTIFDKHYLPVLKFVDTIFDSGENSAARGMWYAIPFFRHSICCFIHDCMSKDLKAKFWNCYLKDDFDGLANVASEVLNSIEAADVDLRLKKVTSEALIGFIKDPRQVTLSAAVKRKSYRSHTPNMISFSSLIHAINGLCVEYGVDVESFIHDTQDEFKSSMTEYIDLFSAMSLQYDDFDVPEVRILKDWKSKFQLKSSSESPGLQACDVFLWQIQRIQKEMDYDVPELLSVKINPYTFSYNTSAEIAENEYRKFLSKKLSDEQAELGESIFRQSEKAFYSLNKAALP